MNRPATRTTGEFCLRIPAPPGAEAKTVELVYTVRRSDRARRMGLRVHRDGRVEVVLPRRAPAGGVAEFVHRHALWIHRHRAKAATRAPDNPAISVTETWYQGRRVPIRHVVGDANAFLIRWTGDHFEVSGADSEPRTAELMEVWFRKAARAVLHERVRTLNAPVGYAWSRIRIADQSTRWGSCSTRGTLSFNWRLLMAPPEVLDYVVIHELAHLKEMNHSAKFWALVEAQCPNYKAHVKWLKDHGATLK
jgi:predicted metal-dependent hydrolase